MWSPVGSFKRAWRLWRVYRALRPLWKEGTMSAEMILRILRVIYVEILRPLVIQKVESSDAQWDDTVLALLDRMFGLEAR